MTGSKSNYLQYKTLNNVSVERIPGDGGNTDSTIRYD